ncbi:MAG: hypothetical protein M4579_002816 [Chaenotheca gracillima]|nr:MAG: hypothetical protein M4579_002816 [Chaenotheca gracillima]
MSITSHAHTQVTTLLARLTTLSSEHKTTQSLITRLAKFPAQPGSAPLNGSGNGENDARVELSSEIHQSLKEQEEALELLRQEVEDLPPAQGAGQRGGAASNRRRSSARSESVSESYAATGRGGGAGDRTRLEVGVKRLGEDLKLAQITAKRASEVAKRKERELLFAGQQDSEGSEGAPRRRQASGKDKLSQDELVANASSDVTAALRRTHQLMSSELSRSQFAQDTLDQSTAALQSLTTHYTNLDTLLSSSRNLLGTLLTSQKSDTWYLESAFYILLCTIAWLVFRRFLYGPLWWFVYLPLKLLFGLGSSITAAVFGASGTSQGLAGTTSLSNTRPPLIVKPSAGGKEDFPKWGNMANREEGAGPSFQVGGGGKGGGGPGQPQATQKGESLSDDVGQMAEDSQKGAEKESQGEADGSAGHTDGSNNGADASEEQVPRNPKKRMWEEPIARGEKDEL